MVLPLNFWLLFGLCMLVSAIGFKNYVWFISLGHGFSIAAEGIALLILYGQNLTLGTVICSVLFILYGLRLGGYLAIREFGSNSYKKNMKGEIKESSSVPFGVQVAIWVTCAALYVTQVSGVFYRLVNAAQDNVFVFIGAAVMLAGVSLETLLNVPRVVLPLVLKGGVDWAQENNCELITAAEMKIINDKRAKEKNKK